jgi:CheY-like chemotaxis protein
MIFRCLRCHDQRRRWEHRQRVFYTLRVESKDPLATTALHGGPVERKSEDLAINGEADLRAQFLILVVDDSADNVAMLSLDLQQQGYRVVTATNGEEAVSVAAFTRPDLILMDISMPRLDGLAATTKIRELDALRDVPVVAITAFGTDGFRRAAYDVGVAGYLTKPIDFPKMHQLVRRLLAVGGSGNLIGNS